MSGGPSPGSTARTRVRRVPDNAVADREALHAVLDAALVAHVAIVDDAGQPYVLPVACARRSEDVLFHGSSASRLFGSLAAGEPTCLTVTLLDGLVVARSAFESSMNYRSAMVLGIARRLEGDDELDALRVISEHLLPGRWADCRQPTRKERAATIVLALALDECSVKVRTGEPDEAAADLADPAWAHLWAGTVPIVTTYGPAAASAVTRADVPVPDYVTAWTRP